MPLHREQPAVALTQPGLVDRKVECAAIDQLVADARRGSSGVLVLTGPAGVGKSALLDYAVAGATDLAVSRVTGVESEVALGYAGLHQLVVPFLDHLRELPDPQRHALETVLGITGHDAPDQLLVGLAVLTLVDRAARWRPTLLVVDDAQWLDDESATILSFVARRLHADQVAMLVAVRDTPVSVPSAFASLPQLTIAGLPETDAREFLACLTDEPIDDVVVDRLVADTQGNPLALVEIVRALAPDQLLGEAPLPEPLPVGRLLRDRLLSRARRLPPEAQMLLLLASAERAGDVPLLQRAATLIGVRWDEAVTSVEASGLATFAPTVTFGHPLIRAAVYHGAALADRRRSHRALAEALGSDADGERYAWHLAAGADHPDEGIAGALELAARRAKVRGKTQTAAGFLVRASQLTPDPARSIARLLEAVRLQSAQRDAARAQPLLDVVFTRVHNPQQQAEAEWTQGLIWLEEGRGRDAMRVLARAVASIERYDCGFPLDALITAENAALYAGSLCDSSLVQAIATTARRLLPEDAPLAPPELLVRGVAVLLSDGYSAAASTLRAALEGLRQQIEASTASMTPSPHEDANMRHLLAVNAAAALLDDAALEAVTRSWVDFGRRTRSLTTLPIALDLMGVYEVFAGRFGTAESVTAEANDVLSFAGPRGHIGESGVGQLFLYAHRGDEERTRATARLRTQDARERGSGVDLDQSHYALAVLDIGFGRYPEALEHLRQIDHHDPLPFSTLAPPLLIEAAVRCGDRATAHHALERFSERATVAGSEWSLGRLECARALLASAAAAESHYRAALDHLSRCTVAFDLARAQLLYGEWLRRARRRREARDPLRTALEFFEAIGARAFAERARLELAATGEHILPRSDAARGALTPQEARIARLVAAGRTNAEIASELYLSTSTVEYHLRKVYRNVGVTTRTQLALLGLPE